MWQIQWMLSFIPNEILSLIYWIIIALGITGIVAGWLGKWIPFYGSYARILKPVGVVLVILGVWLRGGYDMEMAWRAKVAEMEAKVKLAEEQAQNKNVEIQTQIVEKTNIVKEKGEKQIQYIDRVVKGDTVEITKDMSQEERNKFLAKQKELEDAIKNCPVPAIIIEEHNKAATMGTKGDKK